MAERPRKKSKVSISEEDVAFVLQRYTVTTVLALLKEVARSSDGKLDWKELVKNTETGISNAREYQMLWRHLAYRQNLLDELEDRTEPLDDDSDLEYELAAFPPVSHEASAEAVACVKVMTGSDSSDSGNPGCTMVEAPLTINIPNGHSSNAAAENPEAPCSMQGINITVPICVQKQPISALTSTEGIDTYGTAGGNMPPRRKRKPWTEAEDLELIAAVDKYGEGNWANILRKDYKGDRTASQLSQRWAIIRKKKGNKNVGGATPLSGSQLSEAQLAARNAMNLALSLPVKNITSPAGTGINATHINSVRPNAEVGSSVHAGIQSQPAGTGSNVTSRNSGLLPNADTSSLVKAVHQSQAGTSLNSKSSNLASPNAEASSSIPATTPSQQAGTSLKVAPSNPVHPPNAESGSDVQAAKQSHQGPVLSKSSPAGTLGLSAKSRLIAKKPLSKSVYNSDSMVIATAVAAGARIATQSVADSVIKAAKNVHIMPTGGSSSMKSSASGGATAHLPGHPNVHYIRTGRAATPHLTYSSVTTSAPCSGPTRTAPPTIQCSSISSTLPNMSSEPTLGIPSSIAAGSPQQDVTSAEEIKVSQMNSVPKEQTQEDGASVVDSSSNNVTKERGRKDDASVADTSSKNMPEEQVSDEPNKIVPEKKVQKDGVCVSEEPSKFVPEEKVQKDKACVAGTPSKIVLEKQVQKVEACVVGAPSKVVLEKQVQKVEACIAGTPSKVVLEKQVQKVKACVTGTPSKVVLEKQVQKVEACVAGAPSKIVPEEQVQKAGTCVANAPSKIVPEERVQKDGTCVADAPSKIVVEERVQKDGTCVADAPSKIAVEERIQNKGGCAADSSRKCELEEQVQKDGARVADVPSNDVPENEVQKDGACVTDTPSKIVHEEQIPKERACVEDAPTKNIPEKQVQKDGACVEDAPSNRFEEDKAVSSKQAGSEEETIVKDLLNSKTTASNEAAAVANNAKEGPDSSQNDNKTKESEAANQNKNEAEEIPSASHKDEKPRCPPSSMATDEAS